MFDVNLRPPFVDWDVVKQGVSSAWMVKLNVDEARQLCALTGVGDPGGGGSAQAAAMARAIGQQYKCHVCVTAAEEGAALWEHDLQRAFSHAGFKVTAVDAVGAGDAFLAALLDALVSPQADAAAALARANAVGAYVATQRGATPVLDWGAIEALLAAAPPPAAA